MASARAPSRPISKTYFAAGCVAAGWASTRTVPAIARNSTAITVQRPMLVSITFSPAGEVTVLAGLLVDVQVLVGCRLDVAVEEADVGPEVVPAGGLLAAGSGQAGECRIR